MLNLLLFLTSCAILVGFAGFFSYLGRSALTSWIALLSLLANFFVLKQIDLLGFNATASDVFAIGGLLGLNLLQEQYGRKAAREAIWISFSALLFFLLFSQIHLYYQASIFDNSQAAYVTLLQPAPRILLASLVTFLLVDQLDSRLYHQLRQKYPQLSAWWSSALSIAICQLIDTLLFTLLGLYGIVEALLEIIIISYGIKLLAIANTLPWTLITRKLFVKKSCY